jgi:hypothetical protein
MKIVTLLLWLVASSVWAGAGRDAWVVASPAEREKIYQSYREWIDEHEYSAGQSSSQASAISWWSLAWAQESFDCFYGGWPSRRKNGLCEHPRKHGDSGYQNGSCQPDSMQCQPLLFGEGLCVSMATRQIRQQTYANCERKFRASGRNPGPVMGQILQRGNEERLLALFDSIDSVCKSAPSGMCRRLEKRVAEIRNERRQVNSSVTVIDNGTVVNSQEGQSSVEVALTQVNNIQQAARSAGHAPIDCDPSQGVRRVEEVTLPEGQPPFLRERSREVVCTGGETGYTRTSNCAGDRTFAGYSFRNWSLTRPRREINIIAMDGARDGNYLYFNDETSEYDSHNVKSMMFLLPRKGLPTSVENGNQVTVKLTTGEEVTFDKTNGAVLGGVLREGAFTTETNRHLKPPPNVSYTGRGISIRVDHRYLHPTEAGADDRAEVRQGNRVCQVPRGRLWDAEGRLINDTDEALVRTLNSACPGQPRFSIEGL